MSTQITDATTVGIVAQSKLTRGATLTTRQALASAGTLRRLRRGERLFHHAEPAATIALLGKGDVRLCRPIGPGSTRVATYRSAGDAVGERALACVAAYE